ncbi:MAG: SPFH domain-containing protein [Candidatus Diapherotrites archaeon]|nr:SPFH domain-containing protein [Candidatus Diapherotrites archaeon]
MRLWGWVLLLYAFLTFLSLFIAPELFFFMGFVLLLLLLMSVRIVYEYQRGILFTLGKYSGILQPGLNVILPLIQWTTIVDLRVDVVDVPEQTPITKDNVSISVDAVLYYRIRKEQAEKAVLVVENYHYAVSQLAQTTMRDVIGEMTLDEVLSNRDEVSKKIQMLVDKASDPWGIEVLSVELKHIELPESMKNIMAKAAEAERLKRAAIIKASGEAAASEIIAKAAQTLNEVEGGLNLRTLQELGSISSDPSNEVIFFVPLDNLRAIEGYPEHKSKEKKVSH